MAKITVINGLDGTFHVHKEGCRDILTTRANGQWTQEAPATVQELAEDTYADQIAEGSMTPDECIHDHKVYPCAKDFF